MTMTDSAGYPVTGANDDALAAFEQAAHELRCQVDDPVATIERAIAASPAMPMAQVLKAWLHLLGTEPGALAVARECAAAAQRLGGSERERRHADAAALVAAGRWRDGGRALEDLSAAYPRDALALQAGHQVDFFTGDSRMLRDRVARVLPAWSRAQPGYHAVLGMHAFGLEETGDYAAAERQGRLAVELEPRDSWGWHAVAHVMEMRHLPRDGIGWLEPASATWSRGSFLGVHNWWHLALFHLELDHVDEVLRLYDRSIGGPGSGVVLDMVDQSALLWRLHLRGIDAGERWGALAARWAPLAGGGNYAFNDLHAMIAFAVTGREREQRELLDAQRAALAGEGDNAAFTREVGQPATLAVQAYCAGDFGDAVRRLRPIRSVAHRFGGSHAQRDLIDLTLIEAARRSGEHALFAALAHERAAQRPHSALAQRYVTAAG
ncbi:MAG: tetratricopeptide repeat protein [Ideonella sp.]|nr:tetratricopeptide repeat protein [Ideonella sp.]MCC7459636.1 tetratricopeptide repeat protein [Nitrospira sp.]